MNFKITNRFENLIKILEASGLEIHNYKAKFLNYSDQERIDFRVSKMNKANYFNVQEKYLDILNVDTFYFFATIEEHGYYSKLEVNINNVYSGLRLLDYDEGLWFSGQSEEEKALWKTFRVFDTRPEIGDGKMAVFSLQEGISPPNEPIIYFIDRADAYKTNLTFIQYFEAVLDLLGIANWQYLYTNISWNDPMKKDIYPKLKDSLKALEKVFPDKDFSKYFELLESKWK